MQPSGLNIGPPMRSWKDLASTWNRLGDSWLGIFGGGRPRTVNIKVDAKKAVLFRSDVGEMDVRLFTEKISIIAKADEEAI